MFRFLSAKHRWMYIKMAFKYRTSPNHIWKLAHGKSPKGQRDKRILHELLDIGIIYRHR